MKNKISTILTFTALLFFAGCTGIKRNKETATTLTSSNVKEKYAVISWSAGKLAYKKTPGVLTTTFPYTVKDVSSGAVTANTFNGSLKGLFAPPIFLMDLLNIEAGWKNNFIAGGIGFNSNRSDIWSVYFKGGVGHSFPVRFSGKANKSRLLFKTSLSVQYMDGTNERLGSIDNNNKDVFLLGQTAGHQFTIKGQTTDGTTDGTPDATYNANTLDISIITSRVMLVPKLSLGSGLARRFYWSADVAWMIQASENTRLFLTPEFR